MSVPKHFQLANDDNTAKIRHKIIPNIVACRDVIKSEYIINQQIIVGTSDNRRHIISQFFFG